MNTTKKYQALATENKTKLKRLKSKASRLAWLRFLVICCVLTSGYFALSHNNGLFWVAAMLLLALFLYMVAYHVDLNQQIKFYKQWQKEVEMELAYQNGALPQAQFAGTKYVNPQHLYSHDLDLFGPQSFFHHLNRCFSSQGEFYLAHELQETGEKGFEQKQHLVQEISQKLNWALDFRSRGRLAEGAGDLRNRLKIWLKADANKSWERNPVLLYSLGILTTALLINWLIFTNQQNFYWLGLAVSFNLMLTFRHFKLIKKQYEDLNQIAGPLHSFSNILKLVEEEPFTSPLGQQVTAAINGREGEPSSVALSKLGRIVSAIDQLNNVVVLVFLNGLFLFHLHAINRLFSWKAENKDHMLNWLESVYRLEGYVSKAFYALNHAGYTYPRFAAGPEFSAEQLAHPLIAEDKAVRNDISIDNWRFAVLTGSNMSGKSTFLKTLGLSIVMSKVGLPVFAKSLSLYPFKLLTSMKLVDSISRQESYFQAEVLRLKTIKEELPSGPVPFLLLDEILRGTNSDDKRAGTRRFMQRLAQSRSWGVVATHDTDIADLQAENPQVFKALYFESKVVNENLQFDYRLREGICATPNATQLMQNYGII